MEVRVRRIQPGEGGTLKRWRLRALADAPHAFATTLAEARQRTDTDWTADADRRATAPTEAVFFAERAGAIVGMGGVFIEGGHGELVAMWTAPEIRRHGVARRVIEAVAAWCRDAGVAELWTGVADGNHAAAVLYEHAGFTPSGSRPLGSDGARTEWRYRRPLTPT
jgi:GNAT superfamily N-acetyltransferase